VPGSQRDLASKITRHGADEDEHGQTEHAAKGLTRKAYFCPRAGFIVPASSGWL
jgi:hypothetical protein